MITSGIGVDGVGELHLHDTFMLVHANTGWAVATGDPRRLRDLSRRLVQFYWDFADLSYIMDPQRADTQAAIVAAIGCWRMEADALGDRRLPAAELASFFGEVDLVSGFDSTAHRAPQPSDVVPSAVAVHGLSGVGHRSSGSRTTCVTR